MNTVFYITGLALIAAALGVASLPSYEANFRVKRQDDGSKDYPEQDETEKSLGLPNSAKSIRQNLVNEFTCEGRAYGYYADVANECQVFHICYPVTYADGTNEMFKWSFICPNQTIFDQSNLVCSYPLDSLPCEEAPTFYSGPDSINSKFGLKEEPESV